MHGLVFLALGVLTVILVFCGHTLLKHAAKVAEPASDLDPDTGAVAAGGMGVLCLILGGVAWLAAALYAFFIVRQTDLGILLSIPLAVTVRYYGLKFYENSHPPRLTQTP